MLKLLISFSAFLWQEGWIVSIYQWFLVVFLLFALMTLKKQVQIERTKKVKPTMKAIKCFWRSISLVVQIFQLAKILFREHTHKLTIDICQEVVFIIIWIIIRLIILSWFLIRTLFQKLSKFYKNEPAFMSN